MGLSKISEISTYRKSEHLGTLDAMSRYAQTKIFQNLHMI